jgi:hypothetical protein
MDKEFLVGSLFLRLASVYSGGAHGGFLGKRKTRKKKREEFDEQLDRAPWKVELLTRSSSDTHSHKAA